MELVRAKISEDGTITETDENTHIWAWKHPHQADGTVTYRKLEGAVTFDGVDFGYNPEKMVLHDIKMYANPGQKLAFVGSTGAGKTTVVNLINRFYDIQDGKIRFDEINVNKIKKTDLRRSLGVVLQDTHLFTGTVMENIRYGKLDATDEQCIRAAQLANADGFIRRLPNGYDTVLRNDGANLSQGQRQLIAIARAAVADPPALTASGEFAYTFYQNKSTSTTNSVFYVFSDSTNSGRKNIAGDSRNLVVPSMGVWNHQAIVRDINARKSFSYLDGVAIPNGGKDLDASTEMLNVCNILCKYQVMVSKLQYHKFLPSSVSNLLQQVC